MTRFVGRHVAPEMLALWLLESALSFCLAYALFAPGTYSKGIQFPAVNQALVLALAIGFVAFIVGLYRPQVFSGTSRLLLNTAFGGLLAFPVGWIVGKALGLPVYGLLVHDTLWPLKILAVWIGCLFATRLLFLAAVRSNLFVRRVAVLGPPGEVSATVAAISSAQKGFFQVFSTDVRAPAPMELRAARVRTAVLSEQALQAMPQALLAQYSSAGIQIEAEVGFWERHLKRVDIVHVGAEWFEALDRHPQRLWHAALIRVSDVAISLLFLVFTLPLMGIVAALIRLDSPGPVLYRQERVGLGGRPFTLLKFRSMRLNAEQRGPAWAQQCDPRVTRIGAFMRRSRIDELPQLVNVLRGEMSFIGPRPERPHFVEQLSGLIPHYAERSRVKPGLTGWAQVNFPYGASVEDARSKLSYDLYYVKNRSPLLDLLILFATVRVILFQEGAR